MMMMMMMMYYLLPPRFPLTLKYVTLNGRFTLNSVFVQVRIEFFWISKIIA